MPSRARRLAVGTGVVVLCSLLPACTAHNPRTPGDAVTAAEADVLAQLLLRNHRAGGADFVVSVPYDASVVLTLTGEIDFRHAAGQAVMTTSFGDGTADDVARLVFTPEDLWFGDVPGLPAALADAGLPEAMFAHRPVTVAEGELSPALLDVLVTILFNLSARSPDDPDAFLGDEYHWQGQRSIDSRLTSVFDLQAGRSVAVAAADDLLVQFRTPLQELDITVTLAGHGPRSIELPHPADAAEIADLPGIAQQLGS